MALDGRLSELEGLVRNEEEMEGLQVHEEAAAAKVEVAIVGGGLAGLAVLVALQQRGIKAHLYEKYPGLRSDTATAIGIGSNGVTALEGIQSGLSKIISALGVHSKVLKVDTAINENEVSSRCTEWPDASYITVNWKLVQQALAKLVCEEYIHCSHELLFYKQMEDGLVDAYFDVKEEESSNSLRNMKVIHTQMLIGADGIWSAVRRQMVNDEARYLHMVDWNAIVYDPHEKLFENVGRGEIYLYTDLERSMNYLLANAGELYDQTFVTFAFFLARVHR
ncbi:hypothetical protein L7F22_068865 [Adiantum nelumboides]|nr:hypothetical protein [Adiantum nelumboides]